MADLVVLQTLPEAELRSGMAEAIKHGIIDGPTLFDLLGQVSGVDARTIAEAIRVKVDE